MLVCDDALAWITLTRTPALNAANVLAALERLETASGIVAASEALRERAGIPAAARDFLRHAAARPGAAERKWLQNERHHLLPITDSRYPKLLRSLTDCPIALYVAGNIDALCDPQLAVVGSRNPTPQGRDTAFDFAHYLAQRGLAITSGLAQGIDAAAHRGAATGGQTCAAAHRLRAARARLPGAARTRALRRRAAPERSEYRDPPQHDARQPHPRYSHEKLPDPLGRSHNDSPGA